MGSTRVQKKNKRKSNSAAQKKVQNGEANAKDMKEIGGTTANNFIAMVQALATLQVGKRIQNTLNEFLDLVMPPSEGDSWLSLRLGEVGPDLRHGDPVLAEACMDTFLRSAAAARATASPKKDVTHCRVYTPRPRLGREERAGRAGKAAGVAHPPSPAAVEVCTCSRQPAPPSLLVLDASTTRRDDNLVLSLRKKK